jgi:RNA polymerase sigma factor (sigma-70 family)
MTGTTDSVAGAGTPPRDQVAVFTAQRPRLFGLAYRMLGWAHDADDVLQDAWLRWSGADTAAVAKPAAWLTTTVTRLCLSRLASASARHETYPGPWLPEPVLTSDGALGPEDTAAQRDSVSLALLLTLERLTPAERAVYLLREAFAYPHREIAQIVGVSEANARQLHTRARRRLVEADPDPAVPTGTGTGPEGSVGHPRQRARRDEAAPGPGTAHQERIRWVRLVERFLAAARHGDLPALEALLTADVVVWADGGGRVTAARLPVRGRGRVATYLARTLGGGGRTRQAVIAEVNGAPAVLGFAGATLVGVVEVEVHGGVVSGLRLHVNPDKLAYLAHQLSQRAGLHGRTM